jgi:hypothetical protein
MKGNVRRRLTQLGTAFILMICIWGHVSEIFDHWDDTFQTGNDIEYSTVIVVLIAGAVIGFADLAAIALRAVSVTAYLSHFFAASPLAVPSLAAFIGHSPPQTLRI